MVRPHEQRNNRPEINDQGIQAQSLEATRQAAIEAALQVMEDAYNQRLVAIKQAIKSLRLSMNEDRERRQQ